MNPYISDLLSQPATLRAALDNYSNAALDEINLTEFDRIILSGMGSSFNAAYPAWMELSRQSVPVQLVNAAELLHSLSGLIGPKSLLWLNSQSGRSAELVHLLERIRSAPPACVLTFVNDVSSPMAEQANVCVPIHAGEESTVSTKTYTNMLAVNLLASIQLSGGDLDGAFREMRLTADAMESYLADWESRIQELDSLLGDFEQLYIIGRGSSMSAVWNGSLNNKEAAKCSFEGVHAADFRHGPMEVVEAGFTALILAGTSSSVDMNRDLARDIVSYGGKVIWADSSADVEFPTLLIPESGALSLPLVEILPMQLLTLVMAKRKNIEPGSFRHITKITSKE
jgi:glucosamine--fructose-6-phosphate aminotransferase (isomerizing)